MKVWSSQEDLCELLNHEGGISEWIIPLVYNGYLDSSIHWIRPPWSDQFGNDEQTFDFLVGDALINETECAVVTLSDQSYYSLEGVVRDKSELIPSTARPCTLICCTATSHMKDHALWDQQPWILDICLDYFSTVNPFLAPIEKALKGDFIDTKTTYTSDEIIRGLQMVYKEISLTAEAKRSVDDFHNIVTDTTLTNSELKGRIEEFSSQLGNSLEISSFLQSILPHLSLNTREAVVNAGHCILLPHHQSSEAEVEMMLQELKKYLSKMPHPPLSVIIARSSTEGDEFTPLRLVDFLQERVLNIISQLVIDLWDVNVPNDDIIAFDFGIATKDTDEPGVKKRKRSCGLQVTIHDLSKEDAWTKCYSLFVNNAVNFAKMSPP